MNIYPAYISKHSSSHKKRIISLMIPNGEGWHYLAVMQSSGLLRGMTSKHDGDFYCLNYIHLFRAKNKLESH